MIPAMTDGRRRERPDGYAGRVLRRINVRRISSSPWVRAALLLVALAFAAYGLASKWTQVHAALGQLSWYDVLGAALAIIAALGFQMLAWRALLTDLGSPLPLAAATRVNFLGQLGKYVPGAVWAVAGQVSLAQDYRVPKRRSGTASLVSMAITLVVGLVMAGIVLPLASAGALRHYWWVLVCLPVLVVGLWPPVTKFLLDLVLRVVRRPPLDRALSLPGMGRAVGWTALAWVCYGLHAWLLVGDIAGHSLHILLLAAGGYALAWTVGFLLIPFPGGIGPRELALIAVLSPVMPQGPALVVALASRVVATIGDLFWAGIAVSVGRRQRREAMAAGEVPEASGVREAGESAGAGGVQGASVVGEAGGAQDAGETRETGESAEAGVTPEAGAS
jgi:glycosyltransferase 2 family protein